MAEIDEFVRVNRHTGGLEINVLIHPPLRKVNRHTGGLENTGGLEMYQIHPHIG